MCSAAAADDIAHDEVLNGLSGTFLIWPESQSQDKLDAQNKLCPNTPKDLQEVGRKYLFTFNQILVYILVEIRDLSYCLIELFMK